jgi:hypothetical protein
MLFAFFPPASIVAVVVWLELLLGAFGAYFAAAALKLSTLARVLTATAALFSFKTILAVYAGWLPVLAAVTALPFVFAAALLVLDRPSFARTVGLGLAGALALHAGHPQLTYYTAMFVAAWCLVRVVGEARSNPPAAARTLGALLGGLALALGLSAYRLLPIAADLPLVTRSDASSGVFLGTVPLPASALFTVFNPEYLGTPLDDSYFEGWEYIFYLGAVPTILAVYAMTTGRGGRQATAVRVGVLLSALLAIDTPLVRLVAAVVPAYGLFRMPARILFLTSFFGCCLAGIGLDQVLARVPAKNRRVIALLLVAGVVLEGSLWARRYLHTSDPIRFPAAAPYTDALRVAEPVRVAPLSPATPSYGSAAPLGLQLVTGYDPFIFRHYQTYMDLIRLGRVATNHSTAWVNLDEIARWDLLDALNVGFVVSEAPLHLPPNYTLVQAFQDQPQFRFYEGVVRGPVHVYRNKQRLQRAFFASSVKAVTSEDEMLAEVLHSNVTEQAVIFGGREGTSSAGVDDRVEVRRAANGVIELTTQTTERRFLVISEIWHPGWYATIDGVSASLHRADIALLGLWVDPGTHDVDLRFWPVRLSEGLGITALSVGVLLIGLAAQRHRPRRPAGRSEPQASPCSSR